MENFIIYTRWLTWFQMLTPGGNNRTFIFLENLIFKSLVQRRGNGGNTVDEEKVDDRITGTGHLFQYFQYFFLCRLFIYNCIQLYVLVHIFLFISNFEKTCLSKLTLITFIWSSFKVDMNLICFLPLSACIHEIEVLWIHCFITPCCVNWGRVPGF